MGNRDEAADGLQDGLVAAFRRADSFRGEAQVTTWLHRVVVNACLDRLRANKVRAAVALPDDLDEVGDRSEEHTSELQSLMRISYAVFCLKQKHIYYKFYLLYKHEYA